MESKLKKVLLQIIDLKKSLNEIQNTICEMCIKDNLKKEEPLSTNNTILPEDYD